MALEHHLQQAVDGETHGQTHQPKAQTAQNVGADVVGMGKMLDEQTRIGDQYQQQENGDYQGLEISL